MNTFFHFQSIQEFATAAIKNHHGQLDEYLQFSLTHRRDIPHYVKACDSGLFLCKYAEHQIFSPAEDWDFSSNDIIQLRQSLSLIIANYPDQP